MIEPIPVEKPYSKNTMAASTMDKARVMCAVDTHIKTGISSIPTNLSTHDLFGIYATCTDIYTEHANTSRNVMKNLGATDKEATITNAATDAVKSYLSKKYPPIPLKITSQTTPKQDKKAIQAAKEQVRVAENLLKSSIVNCRVMRGSYKP